MRYLLYVFCLLAATCSLQALDSLELTSPNGGEVFPVGTDTKITWEDCDRDEEVTLEYSTDNGGTWV